MSNRQSRRRFVKRAAWSVAAIAGAVPARRADAQSSVELARPIAGWGLQIGDVLADRAIIWSRADRPSRLFVEWSLDSEFGKPTLVRGPSATAVTDFTARVDVLGLPPGASVFVRAWFESLDSLRLRSQPILGRFRTAPTRAQSRKIRFLWSGDTAGQGFGIDLASGGMRTYEAMRQTEPDFFIHSGDNIYADNPMKAQVPDDTGAIIWRNAYLDLVPEKLKVAETLQEFRRAYLYNRYDEHVRAFSAEVPQIWQWDDHEVQNNWSESSVLDARYTQRHIEQLAANANRAFLEYSPMRWAAQDDAERVYRRVPYGPDLDVFVLDLRSYRAGNGCNVEASPSDKTAYFGRAQLDWLKSELKQSKATWKAIASDMPLGLIVPDGVDAASGCPRFENSSNGDGPALGRELEVAELLRFAKSHGVHGMVWFTADVHYCAAHYYDPTAARFREFEPFWEFVAGPLHAGAFGPNALDDTFGPSVVFQKAPAAGQSNQPPSRGLQSFGQVDIDHRTKDLVVSLKDGSGLELFSQRLKARH